MRNDTDIVGIENLPPSAPKRGRSAIRAKGPFEQTLADLGRAAAVEGLGAAFELSSNTKRSYQSAERHFLDWGGLLPTEEYTLRLYLIAHQFLLSASTLSHHTAAISHWHRRMGFDDPTESQEVKSLLKGLITLDRKPKRQAPALDLDDLVLLIHVIEEESSIAACRDSAVIQLGYFGGLSSSALSALEVKHVQWSENCMGIYIPAGHYAGIPNGTKRDIPASQAGILCAAKALRAWLVAADIKTGPVFRPFTRWGTMRERSLSGGSISAIVSFRAEQAGLANARELTFRSLRSGLIDACLIAGESPTTIQRKCGWRHEARLRDYINDLAAKMRNDS